MKEKQPFWKTLNDYRAFPRLFSILFIILIWQGSYWFMALTTPSPEQAAFVSTLIATSAAYFKFYINSGPNANKNTPSDE